MLRPERYGGGTLAAAALLATALLVGVPVVGHTAATSGIFNVREYGAAGDGQTMDTHAINEAIRACSERGGGQVLLPPGRYLSGTVHLRSNVVLKLEAGARLVGTTDVEDYDHFSPPEGTPEAGWGRWHRALILGDGVENVTVTGAGVIDGNKVFDPRGEENMRGPHTIILGNCRNVTIRDVEIRDSANYAVLIEFSERIYVRDVQVAGGWDAVHFRGWTDRPCRDVRIVGCRFFTGDDCIAGRYVENLLVADCVVNSSCNGIRLIGPAKHMIVHDCLFYGPGIHPHRTSDRHNMLSGIILQPGAWDPCEGPLEDVLIADVTMKQVASPVTIWLKRPGNTATDITVSRLSATGVYRSAASVESWTEAPVGRVVFRDVSIDYEGGGPRTDTDATVSKPGLDARELPVWGLLARNVKELRLEDVRLSTIENDLRPVLRCDDVERLRLDSVRFPRHPEAADPLALNDVGTVERPELATAAENP